MVQKSTSENYKVQSFFIRRWSCFNSVGQKKPKRNSQESDNHSEKNETGN